MNNNRNNRTPPKRNLPNKVNRSNAANKRKANNKNQQNTLHANDYYYDYKGFTERNKKYTVPYQYKPRKRFSIAKYIYRLLLLLVFVILISAVVGILFYFNLTRTKAASDISYEFKIAGVDDEKTQKKINLPFDSGFVNNEYYIPINDLMNMLNCKVTGDKSEITFISANEKNFMKFIVNSPVVYINNVEYHMKSASFLGNSGSDSDKLYVPLDFIKHKFDNLSIVSDEKNTNFITVEILDTENFVFKLQLPENLKDPGEGIEPPAQFVADLTEYEKYFSPENREEYIILINQTNHLERDYIPNDLVDAVDTRKDGRAMQQLRLYPAKSLEAFLIESRANGIENITITSGYRSYEQQESIFNTRVSENMAVFGDQTAAETETAKLIAYPGQSEHQSGLCLDMHTLGSAVEIFGETEAGMWLAENAHHFGFIVRYPEDKTHITGISYEPWHFRYVGRFHASKIYDLGMCLEEYVEYLANR